MIVTMFQKFEVRGVGGEVVLLNMVPTLQPDFRMALLAERETWHGSLNLKVWSQDDHRETVLEAMFVEVQAFL